MNRSDKRQYGDPGKPRAALLVLLLAPLTGSGQDVEIHRCPQADGTIAYQEMPCPASPHDGERPAGTNKTNSAEAASRTASPDVGVRDDDSDVPPEPAASRSQAPPSTDRSECEKTTRDAIDAIDDEIRKHRSKEARQTYIAELLELTQQLRACKQL